MIFTAIDFQSFRNGHWNVTGNTVFPLRAMSFSSVYERLVKTRLIDENDERGLC